MGVGMKGMRSVVLGVLSRLSGTTKGTRDGKFSSIQGLRNLTHDYDRRYLRRSRSRDSLTQNN